MKQNYTSKNHAKYLIKYHFIFVCRYRKKLLVGNVETSIKKIFTDIEQISDFTIETMQTDKDHVHLLVNTEPKLSPLSIVNRLKSISTNRIWIAYPTLLKKHF